MYHMNYGFVIFRLNVVGVFTSFQCLKFLCSIHALTLHSHHYAVNLPWEHRTEGLILGSDTIVSVSRSNMISCSPKEIFVQSPGKVCVNPENWETALSISGTQTLFFKAICVDLFHYILYGAFLAFTPLKLLTLIILKFTEDSAHHIVWLHSQPF